MTNFTLTALMINFNIDEMVMVWLAFGCFDELNVRYVAFSKLSTFPAYPCM